MCVTSNLFQRTVVRASVVFGIFKGYIAPRPFWWQQEHFQKRCYSCYSLQHPQLQGLFSQKSSQSMISHGPHTSMSFFCPWETLLMFPTLCFGKKVKKDICLVRRSLNYSKSPLFNLFQRGHSMHSGILCPFNFASAVSLRVPRNSGVVTKYNEIFFKELSFFDEFWLTWHEKSWKCILTFHC